MEFILHNGTLYSIVFNGTNYTLDEWCILSPDDIEAGCWNGCALIEDYSTLRFVLIIISSFIAVIGIGTNAVLARIFIKPKLRTTIPTLYLSALALCDTALCFAYVSLFGVDAMAYYLRYAMAYDLLLQYQIPMFILSRVVQLIIPFLLIFASVERWLWISQKTTGIWSHFLTPGARQTICFGIVVCATVGRMPMVFAMTVETDEYLNCSNHFGSKAVVATFFYQTDFYYIYDYVVTVFQVFIPFVTLLVLNANVIMKLKQTSKERRKSLFGGGGLGVQLGQISLLVNAATGLGDDINRQLREDKARLRGAISTVAIVVATYLFVNLLHVVLTIMERSQAEILSDGNGWSEFYVTSSDVISFLFMFCSFLRLFIYYCNNHEVRKEIRWICCNENERHLRVVQLLECECSCNGTIVTTTACRQSEFVARQPGDDGFV